MKNTPGFTVVLIVLLVVLPALKEHHFHLPEEPYTKHVMSSVDTFTLPVPSGILDQASSIGDIDPWFGAAGAGD